ncbi:MAG: reductive dehalogenase [Proteobacteria bacterium]|nr:reductive dehalogenase [Pseudomonadota bacterium]
MSAPVSRRDLFKLGALGGGLAVAGGVTYGLGALAESGGGGLSLDRPWWVKRVDRPTMGIDDQTYRRFSGQANVLRAFKKYWGPQRTKEIFDRAEKLLRQRIKDDTPGNRLAEHALMEAGWTVSGQGHLYKGLRSWNKIRIRTPAEMGVEPYRESPEDAAALVKRAARFYGAATVGIAQLDRRHLFSEEKGHQIVFEAVDEPYKVENSKMVIPDKCRYAISLSITVSLDAVACAPTCIAGAASTTGYSRLEFLVSTLAEFIRGLGYTAIPSVNDLGSSVALAVDAGLGELARTNRLITPEYGPLVRLAKVLTDLPLAVDKPVDFGLKDFCRVCKRCAEACPAKALSMEDEPGFKTQGEWNNPGHEAWFEKSIRCFEYWNEVGSDCGICMAVCPWSKKDKTAIHQIVKASSSKMPFLAGLFETMDKRFGYGQLRDPDQWWHLDLPEFGVDFSTG